MPSERARRFPPAKRETYRITQPVSCDKLPKRQPSKRSTYQGGEGGSRKLPCKRGCITCINLRAGEIMHSLNPLHCHSTVFLQPSPCLLKGLGGFLLQKERPIASRNRSLVTNSQKGNLQKGLPTTLPHLAHRFLEIGVMLVQQNHGFGTKSSLSQFHEGFVQIYACCGYWFPTSSNQKLIQRDSNFCKTR